MQTRSGADITVCGDAVHKLHRPGTDPRALRVRLHTASRVGALLSPLSDVPDLVNGRLLTRWPLVETLAVQPESVPWVDIAQLLATLHTEPVSARLPPHGWPARLRRAVGLARETRPSAVPRQACPTPRGGPARRTARARSYTATFTWARWAGVPAAGT